MVDTSSVTDFPWQRMFVFDVGAHKDFIERTIGTRFGDFQELSEQVVFLNNREVTRSESYRYDAESKLQRYASFDFFSDQRASFYVIDRSHPELSVVVDRDKSHTSYTFRPMRKDEDIRSSDFDSMDN